jgi:hypothetical protein
MAAVRFGFMLIPALSDLAQKKHSGPATMTMAPFGKLVRDSKREQQWVSS